MTKAVIKITRNAFIESVVNNEKFLYLIDSYKNRNMSNQIRQKFRMQKWHPKNQVEENARA